MEMYYLREKEVTKGCLRSIDFMGETVVIGTLNKTIHLYKFAEDGEIEARVYDFFESPVYSVKILPS